MKTSRLIELERDRLGLIDQARETLRDLKDCHDDKLAVGLEKKHDRLMRDLDGNALDQDEERTLSDSNAPSRPSMGSGEADGADDGTLRFRRSAGWADATGKPVRVLERNERFATKSDSGMSFGDSVRALVTGPRTDQERRALSEGVTTAGGFTVPAVLAAEFIDRLRAKSVAIQAGARTVAMESQTLAIARLDTDPGVAWRIENAAIGTGDPTFSRMLFTAKSLAGIVQVSREVLADSVNIAEMLTNAFAGAMALELDRAAIFGAGTGGAPTGITATAGIGAVSMGTNGAALTNGDKLLDAIYEMLLKNTADPTAMVMHPRTAITLDKMKDTTGMPLAFAARLAAIPKLLTTSAPITETQGTASNASSIVFGDFPQLFIGMREEMTVQLLQERYADNGQVGFLCHLRADAQLAHVESFARLSGITP